ncbi:MAG: hypothetical protein IKY13_04820 [Bacteroidaceae bacterium]|nr:hypothetical protein [Bacteroidaceae bacterium]
MKTHSTLKAILMSLMLACSISAFADGNDSIPPTPIDPSDGKIDIPFKKIIKKDRSLTEPIEAYYYIGEYTIEMEFNDNIGVVRVAVTNSAGAAVYNYAHDTSVECGCTIFLPPTHDCYNITLSGQRYEGYGNVCL